MMNKIIILVFAVLFASCSMQKRCAKCPTKIEIKDSIVYKNIENLKIDSILIPSDEATFEAWLKCDSLGNVYLNQIKELAGRKVKTNVIYKDNYIKVNCNYDSLLVVINSKDVLISELRDNKQVEVIEKQIKYIPFWIYILFGATIIFAFFVGRKF